MLRNSIIALTASATWLTASASAHRYVESNLYVHVRPGIRATIATSGMHFMCSGGDCEFLVPPNSTFEIVAEAVSGNEVRWGGCKSEADSRRCLVSMRGDPVTVNVE
jgi:hypothetical protein